MKIIKELPVWFAFAFGIGFSIAIIRVLWQLPELISSLAKCS